MFCPGSKQNLGYSFLMPARTLLDSHRNSSNQSSKSFSTRYVFWIPEGALVQWFEVAANHCFPNCPWWLFHKQYLEHHLGRTINMITTAILTLSLKESLGPESCNSLGFFTSDLDFVPYRILLFYYSIGQCSHWSLRPYNNMLHKQHSSFFRVKENLKINPYLKLFYPDVTSEWFLFYPY